MNRYGARQTTTRLNLFGFKMSFTNLSGAAIVFVFLLSLVLFVGVLVLLTLWAVWAINDIIAQGATFWNILSLLIILKMITSGESKSEG